MTKYWIEVYWPRNPAQERRKTFWLYYHQRKRHKDAKILRGDRVLFYETRRHPDEDWIGGETIFAAGTVEKAEGKTQIPPGRTGGRYWDWMREVRVNRRVPEAAGVPMPDVRRVLGWGPRATLRSGPISISQEEFNRLESLLGGRKKHQEAKTKKAAKAPRQQNPQKRVELERRAVEVATRWYTGKGYDVQSVERDNLGWDLDAKAPGHTLRVEVKGLSGAQVTVGLTPNEYRAMQKVSLRKFYRLFVVTRAMTTAKPAEFFFSAGRNCWVDGDDRRLKLRPIIGAIASAP